MARVHGHFGEWLQGRLGPKGPLALVTVACSALYVDVLHQGAGPLALDQSPAILPPQWAAALIQRLGQQSGRFSVRSNMPPGGGAGASTAALLALAQASRALAAGRNRAETLDQALALAQACLAIEGATDPLMLEAPDGCLWNSRTAQVLAPLPPLPPAQIVGGFWGQPSKTDPADFDFPDVADLAQDLASVRGLDHLADIARQSADRCTALRGPSGDPTAMLARDLGALGYVRAHTGSARGMIFAPGEAPHRAKATLAEAGFADCLTFLTGGRP